MKAFFKKIKKILKLYKIYDTKYQVTKNSASLSFYMIVSLLSILTIAIQIIAVSNNFLEAFLLPEVVNIFSENFSDILVNVLPSFSLSGFSLLVLLNLFWSSSKTINGINRIADYVYYEIKPRDNWKSRISAFLMLSMLILVIIFELFLVFVSNYLIDNFFEFHWIIVRIIQFILELSAIFFTLLILYMYAPPKKMHVKDAYKGALFSTCFIYLILAVFILIINSLQQIGIGYTILSIISFSLIVLLAINYVIITGIILNYFGNIFHLKSSLFR